jgi:hypothetical protein
MKKQTIRIPFVFFKLIGASFLGLAFSSYISTSFSQTGNQAVAAAPYPAIFYDAFKNADVTNARWSPRKNYSFTGGRTGQGICIENGSPRTNVTITAPLSVENIKGCTIALIASIMARDVSRGPNSWNGIKVMLRIVLNNGKSLWPQVRVDANSFDWEIKSVVVTVPPTADSAFLQLGLEQSTGKVWFDEVSIRVLKKPSSFPAPRDSTIPIEKYHALPALRGTMVSTTLNQDGARVLGQVWGANIIRWQLGGWNPKWGLEMPDFDATLEKELTKLDSALIWCKKYGLLVVADLHSLAQRCFSGVAAQDKLVEVWKTIAARYKNNDVVWAYDLANEPRQLEHDGMWGTDGVLIWEDLAEKVARAVRVVDSVKPIIIESLGADPAEFSGLRPLDFSIPRIIYSAHMYWPPAFTHQGVHHEDSIAHVYPDIINGTRCDIQQLTNVLNPVKEFQVKYRVPIFIGEFSAVRWAPSNSAFTYLKDCIEIFESYGWDWCYHAFREWHGWNVELGENQKDLNPSPVSNDRQQLLRSYFKKNIKPDTKG